MPDQEENKYSAMFKLSDRGKCSTHANLKSLEQEFRDFYQANGENLKRYDTRQWSEHQVLCLKMAFYGHMTRFSPMIGWIIENTMGTQKTWEPIEPNEWFDFV